jgi:hypothetical protein
MARIIRRTDVSECRRCATFCDRVIRPSTCIAAECPALYHYDDPLSGRRFMGCLHKVFATEIDVELFQQAERTRGGFGASGSRPRRCGAVSSRSSAPSRRRTSRASTAASSTGRTRRPTRSARSTSATGSERSLHERRRSRIRA